MSKEQIFDELYGQIASRANNLDDLLSTFLGFLHRKTDFYVEVPSGQKSKMGFQPGEAEHILLNAFRKYPMKPIASMGPVTAVNPDRSKSKIASNDCSSRVEILEDSCLNKNVPVKNSGNNDIKAKSKFNIQYNEDGKQIPVGNGGICDKYYWTQSLTDITIYLDLPYNIKAKELDCVIKSNAIEISTKASSNQEKEQLLSGILDDQIILDECMWTISTNDDEQYTQMILTFDKIKHTWWKCVIKGDTEIDTTKVDSTQKISDYDEVTQGSLRQIMFEQKQQERLYIHMKLQ